MLQIDFLLRIVNKYCHYKTITTSWVGFGFLPRVWRLRQSAVWLYHSVVHWFMKMFSLYTSVSNNSQAPTVCRAMITMGNIRAKRRHYCSWLLNLLGHLRAHKKTCKKINEGNNHSTTPKWANRQTKNNNTHKSSNHHFPDIVNCGRLIWLSDKS